MFLILIVGLALFAFVLDPSSIQSFFSSSKINLVGEVNGEEINREDFARQVEAYQSQGAGRTSNIQAVNAVWNSVVSEKIFETQLEMAGITVGEKDIWDAMVALPEIQNSPLFKNEINLFDEEKLKEYIANMKDEAEAGNTEAWLNWLSTERGIKLNLERQAYTSLVTAGLGASLKEGQSDYLFNNTKMDAEYVFVPYTTIPDSLITVSKGEVKEYVEKYPKKFKPEATRSLQFIRFNIEPSATDDAEMKAYVASVVNDKEEYSNAAKTTVKIPGLKNATDYETFLADSKSDLGFDDTYKFQNQISANVADEVMNASINDVVGPYKQNGYYKVSKIIEITKLPDSVKSSHIIVPYIGSTGSTSTKSKEAAKKTADSIFTLVKNNKSKFTDIANEINTDGTKGKGGEIGWVRKDQAFGPNFDRSFANFIYKNSAKKVGVVETAFGYHVIRIDEQTSPQKAVKLATFARLIEASEVTENAIFEKAETVAANLADGKTLDDIAEENTYKVQTALNLKALAENVPGLGSQRQIVTWAFNADRELNDSKRFDIEVGGKRGYAVVVLNSITEKEDFAYGSEVISRVRPILVNEKKAALIAEKLKGSTLTEVAEKNNTMVRNASLVALSSPVLSGVGNEPAVVGAMSTLKVDETSSPINGVKGVFVVKVTNREEPTELENYDNFRNRLVGQLRGRSYQLYQVLQETAEIEDYRAKFY